MHANSDTITNTYAAEGEILHVMAQIPHLRVRWLKNNEWLLRWDAVMDDQGQYRAILLDGALGECDTDALLTAMASATKRMPRLPDVNHKNKLKDFALK